MAAPASPCLLMLKGSRVREYLQQNQRLLAAPDGALARTRYNKTWVPAELALGRLTPGLSSVILFSDHPYAQFCPVRHATLVDARSRDGYLELDVRLEEFVGPVEADLGWWAALANAMRREPFEADGRKVFVDLVDGGWGLPRAGDDAETMLSWRRVVDFLVGSAEEGEHYKAAAFFRPTSLRTLVRESRLDEIEQGSDEQPGRVNGWRPVGEDLLTPGETRLESGSRYRLEFWSYNPHLTPEMLAPRRLRVDGAGLVVLPRLGGLPALAPDGPLVVDLLAGGGGLRRLQVGAVPAGEVSSFVGLDLTVVGEEASGTEPRFGEAALGGWRARLERSQYLTPAAASVPIPAEELLRLGAWARASLGADLKQELELYRQFLSAWSDEVAVVERHAEIAFESAQWDEAFRLLDSRDGISEESKHRLFLAGLEAGRPLDVVGLARDLDWTGQFEGEFRHFLKLVPRLDERTRRELADDLTFNVWGDDKSCDFLRVLMDMPCDGDLVAVIAAVLQEYSYLFALDADDVLDWLLGQATALPDTPVDLIGHVVYWAQRADHVKDAVDLLTGTLLRSCARRDGLAACEQIAVDLLPRLDFEQRAQLGLCLVDIALRPPAPAADAAVARLVDLLADAQRQGDLLSAEEVALRLDRVLGGYPGDETVRALAREALDDFWTFVEGWEVQRSTILEQVEVWGSEVRVAHPGKTLHVFSGHTGSSGSLGERYQPLAGLTGLDVDVHLLGDLGAASGLRPERDVAIVLTRWAGHSDTEALADRCRKHRVPFFLMPKHAVSSERIVAVLASQLRRRGDNGG